MKRLFLVLALILTSTRLYANSSITAQGGYLHTPNSNYGDGVEGVIRAETPLYGDLNGGIEYAYHGQSFHGGYGSFDGQSLLGELLYHYPKDIFNFKPYVVGGWGWSWWNFNRSRDTINRGIEVKLGNAFAQKYGIGADYPINGNWSINVEWNYFVAHVPKKSFYESDGSFANVVGGNTVGQEETNLIVGLKYKF